MAVSSPLTGINQRLMYITVGQVVRFLLKNLTPAFSPRCREGVKIVHSRSFKSPLYAMERGFGVRSETCTIGYIEQ